MVSGRRDDDVPRRQFRRRPLPTYEQNLRSLGAAIEGGDRPGAPFGRSVANEERLRFLGDEVARSGGRVRRGGRGGGGGRRLRGAGGPPGENGRRLRRSGRPRWSRRRKVVTTLSSMLVVVLLLVAGGYAYLRYRYDQFPKVAIGAEQAAQAGQPFNMLVVGSDSRVGLTPAEAAQAGNPTQVGGQRSDVVMVWHVVPATHQITILSIPRDTMMSMVGGQASQFGRFNRINASFNGGPNTLVQTIEDNLGIPINHVMEVGFGGFEGAVNAVGGVWMDFPYPSKDAWSGLNVTHPGCQLLNGAQALAVARSRHFYYLQNGVWQYDGTSDLGRIHRQDAFLKALIDAAKSKLNPLAINAFLGSLHQGITIDDRFSLGDMIGLAADFRSFSPGALGTHTLPTVPETLAPYGDVLFVDQPAAQQMLVSIFGSQLQDPTAPPPDTNLVPTPPPAVGGTPHTAAALPGAGPLPSVALRGGAALPSGRAGPSHSPALVGDWTTAASQPTSTPAPSFDPTSCTPSG
jgi:LCP family protein required for cell wall assembly